MRDGMCRSVGFALLLGILCAPAARAQDQGAPAGRPWSDPPAKPAEVPRAAEPAAGPPALKPAAAGPAGSKAAASGSMPTAAGSARLAAKPARAAPRERSAPPRAVVRRRIEARVAARRGPPVLAARAAFRAPPVRLARPVPSVMRGDPDVDLWIDAGADRIRRARDGGFLVMRRTTVEDAMGRRMQILRPLDDED